jgi:hypothetical protein
MDKIRRRWTKTVVTAVVVMALAGAAVPVQAANFGFGFGLSFNGDGGVPGRPGFDQDYECMTEREVGRFFKRHGYDEIEIGEGLRENTSAVRANKAGKSWRLTFDNCMGKVVQKTQVE